MYENLPFPPIALYSGSTSSALLGHPPSNGAKQEGKSGPVETGLTGPVATALLYWRRSMVGLQVAYQEDTSFYMSDSCTSFCASSICMTSLEAAKVTAHNLPRVDEFVTYNTSKKHGWWARVARKTHNVHKLIENYNTFRQMLIFSRRNESRQNGSRQNSTNPCTSYHIWRSNSPSLSCIVTVVI